MIDEDRIVLHSTGGEGEGARGIQHAPRRNMAQLEELTPGASVRGILPDRARHRRRREVVRLGRGRADLQGRRRPLDNELLYRDDEPRLEIDEAGRPWSFDGDGALFRLASEAQRIRLAHLFDPFLAVHTSKLEPLPHQITRRLRRDAAAPAAALPARRRPRRRQDDHGRAAASRS